MDHKLILPQILPGIIHILWPLTIRGDIYLSYILPALKIPGEKYIRNELGQDYSGS